MEKYTKDINGKPVNKRANEIIIVVDGMQVINPSREQILADGWVEYVAPIVTPTLEQKKAEKADEIVWYDNSSAVNGFTYGGAPMWLDKATRAGLRNRFISESALGKTTTTLWYGEQRYDLPIETANVLLNHLENYASECYDNTQRHLAEVAKLESIEAVEAYDYTIGYPNKLAF